MDRAIPMPMWGQSAAADFGKNEWTFTMTGDEWIVSAGPYAIVHNDDWDEAMHAINDVVEAVGLNHIERAEMQDDDTATLTVSGAQIKALAKLIS